MKRLTNDNPQNNTETALNLFFVKDGQAWVRRGGQEPNCPDVSLCDFMRRILRSNEIDVDESSDQELSDALFDMLFYGVDTADGLIALLYSAGWAFAELREKLKRYEDTCMEPEDIAALRHSAEITRRACQPFLAAEAAGTLFVLPCKLHEPVYVINGGEICEAIPCDVKIMRLLGKQKDSLLFSTWETGSFCDSDIGKTVFLTREEAEAALPKLQAGDWA